MSLVPPSNTQGEIMRFTSALMAGISGVLILAPSAAMASDEEADVDVRLAQLEYSNGMTVTFTDSRPSNDIGMVQTGMIGRTLLIARDEGDTFLETYLEITPRDVAVPQRLVDDHGTNTPPELQFRRITTSPVVTGGLTPPRSAVISGAAACNFSHFDWVDWHDSGFPGMAPKAYETSQFGGNKRYSDSFVVNCTPEGSPSYLYARHRIYYKNILGNYVKHFDSTVPPWHQQMVEKGSIKRGRKVYYNDGWNSSPNCLGGDCVYTREGRFHD
ncbi:hypothetical protein [Streptosporangium sp. NPDC000396]|uniref:hypothetical protein n=1 Tax=Streptosporangium sp. NPDC000396 TaxID=3366185 RepID=UPI00367F8086